MDFMERMEAGRDQAAYRRHRGLMTGKSAAGWDAAPAPSPEKDTWERARLTARAYWDCDKGGAHQRYLMDVYPERFPTDDLDF